MTVDQYVTNNNTLEVPEEVSPRPTSRLDVRQSVKADACKDAIAEMKEKRWKTTASYVPPASQLNDCFKRVNQKVELKKTMSGNHVRIQRENVQQSLKAAIAYITIEETKMETSSRHFTNSIAMSPGNAGSVGSPQTPAEKLRKAKSQGKKGRKLKDLPFGLLEAKKAPVLDRPS